MELGKNLIRNTALLTASSVVMRLVGMAWQVWLAGRIGAAGIGLFQLVMSVGFLFSTVAISGIRFTVTRLLSEELGRGRGGSASAVVARASAYALFFGGAAAAVLYLWAKPIGFLWVGDARTVPSLRFLAASMPAAGLSAVMAGYFTAVGRVWKTAAEQLIEQLFRMGLTVFVLRRAAGQGLTGTCAAVTAAGCAADALGAAAISVLCLRDRRRHPLTGAAGERLTPRMLRLAVPLALSAYARSALGTFRQLLVPRGLRMAGLSADGALAGYGIVNGMAMPILLFPACLPAALAELLVPALTKKQAAGDREDLRRTVRSLLGRTALLSLGAGAVFFVSADLLGGLIYHDGACARYIRLLSPLVPLIYTDIVTDGCLKGLGEMMRSMTYNVAEAALGLALVWALLPRWALGGYVFVLYVCEAFNFSLSLRRLHRVLRKP